MPMTSTDLAGPFRSMQPSRNSSASTWASPSESNCVNKAQASSALISNALNTCNSVGSCRATSNSTTVIPPSPFLSSCWNSRFTARKYFALSWANICKFNSWSFSALSMADWQNTPVITFKTANKQNEMKASNIKPQTKLSSAKASRASTHVKPPVMEANRVCMESSSELKRRRRKSVVTGFQCSSGFAKYSVVMSVKTRPNKKMISTRSAADHAMALRVFPMQKSSDLRALTNFTSLMMRTARVIFAIRRMRSRRMLPNRLCESSTSSC
mmetsp:Transcript_23354/g.55474  ORF Transcript_23354/g.55474 Transcript_23354/m.55474 type:complete len:270 (-) Transcript_23354:473-1282(-)